MVGIPLLPLRNDLSNRRLPVVTLALVTANICIFVWQLQIGLQESADVFGMIPRNIVAGRIHAGLPAAATLFTSMFLHGGWIHLLSNMLFLWIFGGSLEEQLGRPIFLVFYLVCGLLAGIAQILVTPAALLPMLGASGAIAGVLGGYFLLFPRSRVIALTLVFRLPPLKLEPWPAVAYLAFWFFMQLFALPESATSRGGVAVAAHVGGFLAGLLLVRIFGAGRRLGSA
jgi:membrane associated rhomboid family serine protease